MDALKPNPGPEFNPNIAIAALLTELEIQMRSHDNEEGCLGRMMRLAELQAHYGDGPQIQPPITR